MELTARCFSSMLAIFRPNFCLTFALRPLRPSTYPSGESSRDRVFAAKTVLSLEAVKRGETEGWGSRHERESGRRGRHPGGGHRGQLQLPLPAHYSGAASRPPSSRQPPTHRLHRRVPGRSRRARDLRLLLHARRGFAGPPGGVSLDEIDFSGKASDHHFRGLPVRGRRSTGHRRPVSDQHGLCARVG